VHTHTRAEEAAQAQANAASAGAEAQAWEGQAAGSAFRISCEVEGEKGKERKGKESDREITNNNNNNNNNKLRHDDDGSERFVVPPPTLCLPITLWKTTSLLAPLKVGIKNHSTAIRAHLFTSPPRNGKRIRPKCESKQRENGRQRKGGKNRTREAGKHENGTAKEGKEGRRSIPTKERHAWREGRDGRMEGRNQTTNPAFFSMVLRSLIDKEAKNIGSVLLDGPSNRQQTVLFFSHF
jgi:hypothetical protein